RTPAVKVSFDRPYMFDSMSVSPLQLEDSLVRYLERGGYDVSYTTDVDTDLHPGELLQHRLVLTAGHSEYWSKAMRDAWERARDLGTNLAFMGGNSVYWQIRYEDGDRTIVEYRDPKKDPNPSQAVKTVQFR